MLPSSKFKTAVDTVRVLTPHPCSIGCASTASIQPCPSFILNWALPSRIDSVRGAISTVTSTESSPERLGISASESESSDFPVFCSTFSSTFSCITSIFSAISSVPPHAITANKLAKTNNILKYFILINFFILFILIVLNFEYFDFITLGSN